MRLWPRRTDHEKREDTYSALVELAISFAVLSVGLVLLSVAGYLDPGYVWLFIPAVLITMLGVSAVGQSLFGLLIEVSVGAAGAMVVLSLAILVFMIFQGYGILME